MDWKSIAQGTGLQIPTSRRGYFMGKNTPDRQQHIIQNLRIEVDILEEEVAVA